jgi:hypothetical protein
MDFGHAREAAQREGPRVSTRIDTGRYADPDHVTNQQRVIPRVSWHLGWFDCVGDLERIVVPELQNLLENKKECGRMAVLLEEQGVVRCGNG